MEKLDTIDLLMNIDSWTDAANSYYHDLFDIDKNAESVSGRVRGWIPDHRLNYFRWDEACEYPLPDGLKSDTSPVSDDECALHEFNGYDLLAWNEILSAMENGDYEYDEEYDDDSVSSEYYYNDDVVLGYHNDDDLILDSHQQK